MRALRRCVERLEHRMLLAATFDLIDLGVSTEPDGGAVLDVNEGGFILGRNDFWRVAGNGRVLRGVLNDAQSFGSRFNPYAGRVAVGSSDSGGSGADHAFIFRYHTGQRWINTDLGTLPSGGSSSANAMELLGTVVGKSDDPTPGIGSHGFVASYRHVRYQMFDLNDLLPAGLNLVVQEGVDINRSRQILVRGVTADDSTQARFGLLRLRRAGSAFIEFSAPPGLHGVQALDLNELGEVVGTANDAAGNPHALLWRASRHGVAAIDLGSLGGGQSQARGINNNGVVVGDSTAASGRTHGFLYDPAKGKLVDLNSIVDRGGFVIRHAVAINGSTQIAADAVAADGQHHAVLLVPKTPTPPPRTGIRLDHQHLLTVNGTPGDDTIIIQPDPRGTGKMLISLNGSGQKFAFDLIGPIRVNAGAGNDDVEIRGAVSNRFITINGDGGNDTILADGSDLDGLKAYGGDGDDLIRGCHGRSNYLQGDRGNDTLIGGARFDSNFGVSDQLIGGYGDDSLISGNGRNVLRGESGNDTLTSGERAETLAGGAGDDSIFAGTGGDSIQAGSGDDTVDAGPGGDLVYAGAGDDHVAGGEGDDFIYGDQGDDTILGQSGNDTLGGDVGFGGDQMGTSTPDPGNDLVDGGKGNDYLLGSRESEGFADDNGRDTLLGGANGDIINARGNDLAPDMTPDDIIPALRRYGAGLFAVQQTATLRLYLPANEQDGVSPLTPIVGSAGRFDRSPFYADADGTLHMQDTINRLFYLGEFFRNWGVPIGTRFFGRFSNARVTINGNLAGPFDKQAVHQGDVIEVHVVL